MSCGVDHRRGSDPELLWLWHRPAAAATAPIRPLAWEPPHATGAALEKTERKKISNCLKCHSFFFFFLTVCLNQDLDWIHALQNWLKCIIVYRFPFHLSLFLLQFIC